MYLSRLTIKNFRVIRQADLVLPDKIVGVVGPNGAGKSSLVEAIAWALYGNLAARSSTEEIRSRLAPSAETCEVRLEFSTDSAASIHGYTPSGRTHPSG